jgi:hypothetical protein
MLSQGAMQEGHALCCTALPLLLWLFVWLQLKVLPLQFVASLAPVVDLMATMSFELITLLMGFDLSLFRFSP